jgi:hypothetical protein
MLDGRFTKASPAGTDQQRGFPADELPQSPIDGHPIFPDEVPESHDVGESSGFPNFEKTSRVLRILVPFLKVPGKNRRGAGNCGLPIRPACSKFFLVLFWCLVRLATST